jgi:hypothetical protein
MTTAIIAQPHVLATGKAHGPGPVEWQTANGSRVVVIGRTYQDERTLGRSIYVAGGTLEECRNAAQRAGFVGAEADARKADLRALLAVGFDEWQLHRAEYDAEDWS